MLSGPLHTELAHLHSRLYRKIWAAKLLLKAALTDQINDREVYMRGVDASYRYEGYNTYKTGDI